MKKIAALIPLLLLTVLLNAETEKVLFETGSRTPYFPVGAEILVFDDAESVCVVSKIAKYDNAYWEIQLTAPALSNDFSDSTYPVVVSYILKPGDTVVFENFFKSPDAELYPLTLLNVTWNKAEFSVGKAVKN